MPTSDHLSLETQRTLIALIRKCRETARARGQDWNVDKMQADDAAYGAVLEALMRLTVH